MNQVFSGEALDGLLGVLVDLGGDAMDLETDTEPQAKKGERPLRLTLPETSNATLTTLFGAMVAAHHANAGAPSSFTYSSKSHGGFLLEVDGDFRAVVRIRVTRGADVPALGGGRLSVNLEPEVPDLAVSRLDVAATAREVPTVDDFWTSDEAFRGLVQRALDVQATDIHLTRGDRPRFRSGKGLVLGPSTFGDFARLLSPEQREQVDGGQSLDFGLSVEGRTRLRVHVFSSASGLCAAVRLLSWTPPALASLGLADEVLALRDVSQGFVLICGNTGSGKSTTLAALLQARLDQGSRHLVTFESPIEYVLGGGERSLVRQREVGRHVPSFAAGLRDALREDPDELMIGEMRDPETTALALSAAETGHVVWSSLHARTARSAIERIVDQVPPAAQRQVRGQLAESLRAIVSQRLIAADGGSAREGSGTPHSRSRLVVASEVMTVTPAVAHLIREGKTEQLNVAIHSGKDAGMVSLEKDLARLVKQGKLSRATARLHADDAAAFDRYV
jgi:twitching motility protein PilT